MLHNGINLVNGRRVRMLWRLGIINADDLAANLLVEGHIHGIIHIRGAENEASAVQVKQDWGHLRVLKPEPQRSGLPEGCIQEDLISQ